MMLLAGLPYIEKSDLYTAHANSSEATFQHHGQRAPDISLSSKQTTLQRQISDEAHYCGSASLNNAMNQ